MKLATLYITMSLIGVVLFISSCATQKVNLVDEGIITVEPKRSKKVIIDRVKVYQDNENAVISGRVRRQSRLPSFINGHVDVTILKPDGAQLKKAAAYYYPRQIQNRRAGGGSSFKVRIPFELIRGSKVRVDYHNGLKTPAEERINLKKYESIRNDSRPRLAIY